MGQKYSIGLDIGTNSVGWAVIRDHHQLVRKRVNVKIDDQEKKVKKNFWGVRLFEEGQTAEATRLKRTQRRRYTRRRNRLRYLQELFAEDMAQVDQNFFERLEDSFLVPADKRGSRQPIFGTIEEEVDYHQQYPTIYHLRSGIANSHTKFDLRLAYLAMAHIMKFRGHFLIEGKLDSNNTSVAAAFEKLIKAYNEQFSRQDDGSFFNRLPEENQEMIETASQVLQQKISPSRKVENVLKLFEKEPRNGALAQFLKLAVGNQADFKNVFDLPEEAKLQVPKEEFEEDLERLLGQIGDDYADIFQYANEIYNAIKLAAILKSETTTSRAKLSDSLVSRYQEHQGDLKTLKQVLKKLVAAEYHDFFNDSTKHGYAGYIDGSTNEEDFYKYTKKLLEPFKEEAEVAPLLAKIDAGNFLRKQRTFDNGVIPHQLHQEELTAIIDSQSEYYPFLKENREKIITLFAFRIPYYVGPLTANQHGESRFAWLTKKTDEPIRPWNFDQVVNREESAETFIQRMTNWDTYLPDEKVLPKHSLLYELFEVLNELTKVSYTDDQGKQNLFSSEQKGQILRDLFKVERKVTRKMLENYLHNELNIESPSVKGIEQAFLAKLGTYHDFIKVGISRDILDDETKQAELEELVKILTVFEDRQMLRTQLSKYADLFDGPTLKKLERKHYTGWGRLSKALLQDLRDTQTNKSIMDYLLNDDHLPRNRNRNFMQLINDRDLSFKQLIESRQSKVESDDIHLAIENLAGSPAIKKGIHQSIQIVDELVAIMGSYPDKIVVEMARENQTTTQGRNNSRPRLNLIKAGLEELGSNLLKEQPVENEQLRKDALFLYYLQNGKDMYTGEALDIHNLSNYDIDHIIPQSLIDDDSFENRVLVSSSENRHKSDGILDVNIVYKMDDFWQQLLKAKLISPRKYAQLTLTRSRPNGFTEEDKAGFIRRQLVETRQITKHVARLLHERFNQEGTPENQTVKVVTLKSAIVSRFRRQFEMYKVREVNDYHHAHDAYLNAVVANIILKVYPKLEPEFVYGDYYKPKTSSGQRATDRKNFYSNVMRFFETQARVVNEETGELLWSNTWIGDMKKTLGSKQMNIVKKTEIQTGGFSKETIKPKGDNPKLIPRKSEWATEKYGGFDSPLIAYSALVAYDSGGKVVRKKELIGITVMNRDNFEKNPKTFLLQLGLVNPQIIRIFPKYTLFEFSDGRRRILASYRETQKGNQLVLPEELMKLLYHAKHAKEYENSKTYLLEHRTEFGLLLEIILDFSSKYTLTENKVQRLRGLLEKWEEQDILDISLSFIELLKLNEMKASTKFEIGNKTISPTRYLSTGELINSWVVYQSVTGLKESRFWLGD